MLVYVKFHYAHTKYFKSETLLRAVKRTKNGTSYAVFLNKKYALTSVGGERLEQWETTGEVV